MKYYVISDIHGYYDAMIKALTEKGYFEDKGEKKIIICGDLLDRGPQNKEIIDFVLELMKNDGVILIRGNHEDLYEMLINDLIYDENEVMDIRAGLSYHIGNGTWGTALDLTGFSAERALARPEMMANFLKNTVFYKKIMPKMIDYYETEHYIFTHGYIPCHCTTGRPSYSPYKIYYFNKDWRNESRENWSYARWYNGIEFVCQRKLGVNDKTVVVGHWHASYGHSWIENKGSTSGIDADYTTFYGEGIIALDACTARSGFVNCEVIED